VVAAPAPSMLERSQKRMLLLTVYSYCRKPATAPLEILMDVPFASEMSGRDSVLRPAVMV
jgi:hypothetical protein